MNTELAIFDPLTKQITEFVAPAAKIKVIDHGSCADAVESAKEVKSYEKRIETLRKQLVSPLNDRVKQINAFAAAISEPLEKVERHLKSEVLTFNHEQEKKRQAEIARIEKEQELELRRIAKETKAEKKGVEDENQKLAIGAMKEAEAQVVNKEARSEVKAIEETALKGVRKTWKAEVMLEASVPREFLSIDMKKINAALRAGVREIPGVRIFEETSLSLGANTSVPDAAIAQDYFRGSAS
jgi:hypothetical protein